MNIDSILKYNNDPSEDYYTILGSVSSSTKEQILQSIVHASNPFTRTSKETPKKL
ncbi:DnaJ -like protein subfamily C member 12, partial [Caligus rogercresseyi]